MLVCDATAALGAASNLNGSRNVHMQLADTFLKKCIRDKLLKTMKVGTKDQEGDLFTEHDDAETPKHLSKRYKPCGESNSKKVEFRKLNTIADLRNATELVKNHKASDARRQWPRGCLCMPRLRLLLALWRAQRHVIVLQWSVADHPCGGVGWLAFVVFLLVGCIVGIALMRYKAWIEGLMAPAIVSVCI